VSDARLLRISRELFLAAFGIQQETMDSWVIDRLTSLLDEEDIQAGQTLCTVGEPLEFVYFMQNGSVQMTRAGASPWTFQGRWVLGGFEAYLERPLTRDATALTDFLAMKVRPNALLELIEDSFLLARSNVRFAAATVARLEERVPGGLPKPTGDSKSTPAGLRGSMSVVERLAFLAEVAMLRGAGVQPLVELAVSSRELTFELGEQLFERGVASQHILVLVDGEVHARRAESDATWHYGPRDIVCGAAAVDGTAAWDVKAAAATHAISFPIEVWFELMDEHFELVRAALVALALRREALLDHLAEQSNGIVLT
jgi:CRP-like cAMP-binding protein